MAVDLSCVPTNDLLDSVRKVSENHPQFRDNHQLLLSIVFELGHRLQEIEHDPSRVDG